MLRAALRMGLGGLAVLLACELLFRVLPVSTATATGYYIDPDILTYPPQHSWRMSTGWDLRNAQTLHSNAQGFASERDFAPDPNAVALVGDSFIQSSMLPVAERPAAQLEQALAGRRAVFSMGCPGTALLDYAERIRLAQQRYGVRDFVVLMERGDVRQSLCGSGNIHSPCIDRQTLLPRNERLDPPSLPKRLLRESALAQYLVSQLKLDPKQMWRQLSGRPVAEAPASVTKESTPADAAQANAAVEAVTAAFLQHALSHVSGKLVILVDSDRAALQRHQAPAPDPERQHFIAMAQAAGVVVIDTEPLFKAHFESSSLSLDVGPYDAHLNALAHRIVARAAAAALQR